MDDKSDHNINMYTVVIDSNYPYNLKHLQQIQDSSKYLCAIRVIDSSLYKEPSKRTDPKYATVVIIGDRMEDMPVTRQIGDILRIQKATKKITKEGEIKYLVDERSNWCLFSAEQTGVDEKARQELIQFDEFEFEEEEQKKEQSQLSTILNMKRLYMPYKYSGKIFNFAENEEKIVNNMRNWCMDFFKSSTVAESLLANIKSYEAEKNLLCKVMKVYEYEEVEDEENETYLVRLKDKNNKLWKMKVDRIKYPELRKGDIIRIKSAKGSIIEKENVLESKPHTNILKFISDSLIVKNLTKKIQDTNLDVVIRDKEEPLKPIFVTQDEANPWAHLKVSSLVDIFFPKEDSKIADTDSSNGSGEDKLGTRYLVEFDVLSYTPRDIKEFVKGL